MGFKVAQVFDIPNIAPDHQKVFDDAGFDAKIEKSFCLTEEDMIKATSDADAIIGIATFQPFTRKVIEGLRKCRFIQSMGIGYDQLDVAAATEHCILVANVPDYCLDEVSDHAMALMLACTRRIVKLNELVKSGNWKSEPDLDMQQNVWPNITQLKGLTLGLIGFGRIPQTLVPKARAFGLKIIVCDPYVADDVIKKMGVEKVSLDQLLKESDVLSIHCALTPETHHMLGLEELKKMKPTAHIVNTARGPIIDGKALYTALKEGIISTAAVDVTEPEPISPDDPLLTLDNFIVTAHSAHYSPKAFKDLIERPGREVMRVLKGEWPVGLLNPQVKEKYIEKWGKTGA
ncbi:MAG: C-terminal binding protein [Thermodesulfobacteriota bacterium]|nr:C-terminal binding protein [Thermodesulfobacteriota bacterium]